MKAWSWGGRQPQAIPTPRAFVLLSLLSAPAPSKRSGCWLPKLGSVGGYWGAACPSPPPPRLTSPPGAPLQAVPGCSSLRPARPPARSSSPGPPAAAPASPGSSPPAPGAHSRRPPCPGAAAPAHSRGAAGTPRPRGGLCPAGSAPAVLPSAGCSRAAAPPAPASAGGCTFWGGIEGLSRELGGPSLPPGDSGCPWRGGGGGGRERGRRTARALPLLQAQLLAFLLLRAHVQSPVDFLWGTRVEMGDEGLGITGG